jgi:chloramphenicol O-acetyltransferase type A
VGEWVDLKKWDRWEHYKLFRSYAQPFFSVTVDADVTAVWKFCRKPGNPPFFLTTVFLMLKAVNDVDAFRLRLRPRGVWRHDTVAAGPTIPRPNGTFAFVRLEPSDSLEAFVAGGKAAIAAAMKQTRLQPKTTADDIVFHSVLPWFRFRSFTNALPGGDSIPRIVFGRCTPEDGRVMMPMAIEVHHALVDGLDVARVVKAFETLCRFPGEREQRAAKRHVGVAKRD